MEKKIQFAVVLAALAAAVIVAVYLFTQSRKIEVIEKQGPPAVEEEGNRTAEAADKVLEPSANATGRQDKDVPEEPDAAKPKRAEPKPAEQQPDAAAEARNVTTQKPEKVESGLAKSMVTPRFVTDLAEFVVARYHPPKTVDNPDPQGTSTIDFKTLNARYGLELIGLRQTSPNLRKAREDILTFVMDPKVIRFLYDQYADVFVDTVVDKARQAEKRFLDPKEMRKLEERHIEELLRLNAQYIDNVAEVFKALGKNASLPGMVESYLQAEKDAVHANFVLNQKQNELAVMQKEIAAAEQTTDRMQMRLQKLEEDKESAAQDYKEAIQHRERTRQRLIQIIQDQAGQIRLETHEILYIAEWVHRRISEGENSPAIVVGSEVLVDLAKKLRSRAAMISG